MIKLSIIQKLKILFVLALALIFVNATVYRLNTINLMDNQKLVMYSREIIPEVEKTLISFQDAEISARNYLITKNKTFLTDYIAAREKIKINLKENLILTNNSPKTQNLINLLKQKINQQINILETEIKLRKNPDFQLNKDKLLAKDIQELIIEIENESQKSLAQNLQKTETIWQNTQALFSIVIFGDLLLVGVLYYFFRRYIIRLKETEFALQKSENRLRAIIDAETECIKLIAQDGKVLEINTSGLEMLEIENPDILIGKSVLSAILPEYREAFNALHKSVCQGNKERLEFEIIGRKGTRRWVETHAVPLPNESDDTFLHLAVTRDITRRKKAEQKIREQAALLDVATDAISVRNIHNEILFWNKSCERLYGWKAEEAVGKNASELVYKETSPQIKEALLTVLQKGEWRGELNQIQKDGREIIVESRWTLVRNNNGEPKSILTVNTEITQKKQLEAQLFRSQRLESIGTLASGIAHDLNNVLSPILMSVQLLQMKLRDRQSEQILITLENNVKRGANLIKQLLSFARGIESQRTILQVKHLLAEIGQIITQTFPKSIIFDAKIAENLSHIYGDTTQLHQVLMNLVVNARDAMPDGGILSIVAENLVIDSQYAQINIDAEEGAYIVITIKDTGIGMPAKIQERIFEPFFSTKEVGRNTGLGLSTALGIIKNHGGFVNFSSEVGKGTQFKVYFPSQLQKENNPVFVPQKLITGNGELILIVDDEVAIREITKSTLETYNYQVITAADGVETIAIYAQHRQEISVVLLDMMMPSMEGAQAIRTLQKINPEVKIIAISGLLSNQHIALSAGVAVKAFISKPCTANELLQTISEVIKVESGE